MNDSYSYKNDKFSYPIGSTPPNTVNQISEIVRAFKQDMKRK